MTYRLAIFDFDGTLADSLAWFLLTAGRVADHFGLRRIDEPEIADLRSRSAREILGRLGVPMWKLPFIARYVHELARREPVDLTLFDGIDRMIDILRDNDIALAIVSSNREDVVRRTLGQRAGCFGHFSCGASLFGKASRFRKALALHGLTCRDAICIGDEIRDAEAAKAAGIDFGAVAWGFNHPDALAGRQPKAIFKNVEDIVGFLAPERSRVAVSPAL